MLEQQKGLGSHHLVNRQKVLENGAERWAGPRHSMSLKLNFIFFFLSLVKYIDHLPLCNSKFQVKGLADENVILLATYVRNDLIC